MQGVPPDLASDAPFGDCALSDETVTGLLNALDSEAAANSAHTRARATLAPAALAAAARRMTRAVLDDLAGSSEGLSTSLHAVLSRGGRRQRPTSRPLSESCADGYTG